MARRKKTKKGKNDNQLLRVLVVLITILVGLSLGDVNETFSLEEIKEVFKEENSTLRVSFLDVGQADCILIENKGEAMLIDAGNNEDGELLVKYFKDKNITNFKYVIGTHPHEDHIGGMDDIINNFEVESIYIPDAITTTKTFLDVLEAIDDKGMTYKVPKIGEEIPLGNALVQVLYTGTDTSDLNNTSIVVRLTFGKNSFLFMGDATDKTERKILSKWFRIESDVLKVGHHGSKYSSTDRFLDKVNPKYAIISVGQDNSYKHPEIETLDKLENRNIKTHRTDLEGSIIVTSNGEEINVTSIKTNVNGG